MQRNLFVYRITMICCFLSLIYMAIFFVLYMTDMFCGDISREEQATITKKYIKETKHYRYQKIGKHRQRFYSHSTYQETLDFKIHTAEYGDLPDDYPVSEAYYKSVEKGDKKTVQYKRGYWIKPFGEWTLLNRLFFFNGKPHLYITKIVD